MIPAGGNLAAALVKAQGEFPTIEKRRTAKIGGSYSYKYADLSDVLQGVGPALRKHGLVLIFGADCTNGATISAVLLHESGEALTATLPLAANADPKQTGSQITYLKRYLAGLLTGVATDDDDDGHAAAAQERPRKGSAAKGRTAAAAPAPAAAPAAPVDSTQAMRKEGWEDIKRALTEAFGTSLIWESIPKKAALKEAFGTADPKAIAKLGDAGWAEGVEMMPAAIVKAKAASALNRELDEAEAEAIRAEGE